MVAILATGQIIGVILTLTVPAFLISLILAYAYFKD